MSNVYQGGCHCGRVRFRVTADLDRRDDLQLLDLHQEGHFCT